MQKTDLAFDKEHFNDLYREAFMHKNWKALRSPMVYEYDQPKSVQEHLNFVNGFLSAYATLCLRYLLPRLQSVCRCKFCPKPVIRRNDDGAIVIANSGLLLSQYEICLSGISNLKPLQDMNIKETQRRLFYDVSNIGRILRHFRNHHSKEYAVVEHECGFWKVFTMFVAENMIYPSMKK